MQGYNFKSALYSISDVNRDMETYKEMLEIKITEGERLPFMSSRLGMAKEKITELEDILK